MLLASVYMLYISLYVSPVIIGFQELHYIVNENDGRVRVCVVVLAGHLTPSDSVSLILTASSGTADCKLIGLLGLHCNILSGGDLWSSIHCVVSLSL